MPQSDSRPHQSVNTETTETPPERRSGNEASPSQFPRGPGRPRDPLLEDRVFDAAMEIYARGGWRELTFGAVARAAGVGKASLYKRWPTRGDLLREMLEARWYPVSGIDTGSLRGDLLALAGMSFDALTGPYGGLALRLPADLLTEPEVYSATRSYARSQIRQTHAIMLRGIERGQLPGEANPALVADIIIGTISSRIAATPLTFRPAMIASRDHIIMELVDLTLRGSGAVES